MITVREKHRLQALFSGANLDSAHLSINTMLAVKLENKSDRWHGVVVDSERRRIRFRVVVVPSEAPTPVTIDLGTMSPASTFTVSGDAVLLLTVSNSINRYAVRISKFGDTLLDNKMLQRGQFFSLRLFRPGVHELRDRRTGAKCDVTVEYPIPGQALSTSPDAAVLKLRRGTFFPPEIRVAPTRPVTVNVDDGSHITTVLTAITDRIGGSLVTKKLTSRD